jgi:hypothetical protein
VSGIPKYLKLATRIGEDLLTLYINSLSAPFIGVEIGQFGSREVFIDSISSIYPVFASLAVYNDDEKFIAPIKAFLSVLNKSVTKKKGDSDPNNPDLFFSPPRPCSRTCLKEALSRPNVAANPTTIGWRCANI